MRDAWFVIMLPGLNLFSLEHKDPLLTLLLLPFSTEAQISLYILGQLLILFAGLFLLAQRGEKHRASSLAFAVGALVSLLYFGELNPLWLKLHYLPLLLHALIGSSESPTLRNLLLAGLFSLLFLISAGNLSVFGILLAFLAVAGLRGALAEWRVQLLLVVALFFATILIPAYNLVSYPPLARLTPISPLLWQTPPLLGPSMQPEHLLYSALRTTNETSLLRLGVVALALAGAFLWPAYRKKDRALLKIAIAPLILLALGAIVPLLDLAVSPSWQSFTLFQALRRIIPGLALLDLPWALTPAFIIVALTYAALSRHTLFSRSFLLAALLLTSSAVLHLPWVPSIAHAYYFPALTTPPVVQSPSSYVVQAKGLWVADKDLRSAHLPENLVALRPAVDFQATTTASTATESSHLVLDNRSQSRWATGRPQHVGDFFEVRFDHQVPLIRVTLSTKNHPADFPRGLRVLVSEDGVAFTELLDEPSWLGPVNWTTEGYPYFGPQQDVTIDFPEQRSVRAVRFVQIGEGDRFDWSIEELLFFRRS